jgi:hypothetical protein
MTEDPGDGREESSRYVRLPLPIVAGGLLAFVVLVLAVGLYANRNLRPQPGLVATPVALPTATLQAAAAAIQTPTATATPLAAPTAKGVVETTLTATPTLPSVPTARPTVNPELAAEIGDAYQAYWQVRAEALYDLDASRLDEVMAGDHLAAIQELIDELRAEGHAIQTSIDHKYVVVEATSNTAKVVDKYVDQSVFIDLQTHSPITSPTGQAMTELYSFDKLDGTWRVVGLARSP